VHGPMTGAGNIGFDAFVAAALFVRLEGSGQKVGDFAGRIELFPAQRRRTVAKLVIKSLIAKIALLVRYPFLQPPMRLDRELSHCLSLACPWRVLGGIPDRERSVAVHRRICKRRPSP